MSIFFDKSNKQYVEVPYVLPQNAGTIELEIVPMSLYNYNCLWENSVHADDWEAWIYNDGIIGCRDGDKKVQSQAITLDLNTWRHIAFTWDKTANQIKLYLDGILVSTNSHNSVVAGTYFRLGGKDNTAPHFFAKNFRIWSTCRTATEINDNKNAELIGNETGLEIYWKLNELSGSTVYDSTPNARNGTAYGSYSWMDGISSAIVTQVPVEVLLRKNLVNSTAVVTQAPVEVLGKISVNPNAIVSSLNSEILLQLPPFSPYAVISSLNAEVLILPSDGVFFTSII